MAQAQHIPRTENQVIPEEDAPERDPYEPVQMFAKELSGYDIGDEMLVSDVLHEHAKYEFIGDGYAQVEPAKYEDRWLPIRMITHSRSGRVNVRTGNIPGKHDSISRHYEADALIEVREVKPVAED